MSGILDIIRLYLIDETIIIDDNQKWSKNKLDLYFLRYRKFIGLVLLLILGLLIIYCNIDNSNIKQNGGDLNKGITGSIGSKSLMNTAIDSKTQKKILKQGSSLIDDDKKIKGIIKSGVKNKIISGFAGAKDLSLRAAENLKNYSPIIYRILYTIAFTLILAIIVLPSISFIVVGMICFFLLQNKIEYIKTL